MPEAVLVVEDEPILRVTLANDLGEAGYAVTTAADGAEGLRLIETHSFGVALLDLRLPKVDGLTLLRGFKARNSGGLAIMMTAYGTIESAVTAMKAGAADYVVKPFPSDELVLLLRGLLAQRRTRSAEENGSPPGARRFCDLVYASEAMAKVCGLIATVAESDATMLIQGETGTGKELVARAIHQQSRRRAGPLIKVACAAIPEALLEAELFGHQRGAFTGAIRDRKGRFELAHRGSLFLDEISDLGAAVQAKLLRVLQEREFERIGGVHTVKVDVRVISATRTRLEQEVVRGAFREDLFYRLKVLTITIPPLRERKQDIVPLAEHFLAAYRRPLGRAIGGLTAEARGHLLDYDWPGNVRELEACIQRAVTLSKNETLTPGDLFFEGTTAADDPEGDSDRGLIAAVRETERRYLRGVLRSVGGQRKRAAEILGISRKTLWKKLKLLGLE